MSVKVGGKGMAIITFRGRSNVLKMFQKIFCHRIKKKRLMGKLYDMVW
jgi:hypothetical protein